MAHFQNQSDGNPIRTDEFGNPDHHIPGTGAFGHTTGIAGTGLHHGGGHAVLHRSGSSSSSSSSSEDDGHGGRRKKGLKQKIKEKLPGGGHKDAQANYDHHSHSSGFGTYDAGTGQHHQKKGIMDKIKDKLPGQH